jgi:hypothetical protein
MKRPEQHLIDSAGQRLLREVLEPLGWVVRDVQEQDYGIDFDVEVFRRSLAGDAYETTGVTFKAQLKSSKSSAYSGAGDFVSEPIAVSNLRYLARQLNVPTIVMHADIARGRLYWHAPQLDRHLERALAERTAESGSITIRVPTANELPKTADELLDALTRSAAVLAGRSYASVADVAFFEDVAGRDNSELLRAMQQKTDLLTIAEAERLLASDQHDEARRLVEGMLNDPRATVETKFTAELIREPIEMRSRIIAGASDEEREAVEYESALRLCDIAKAGPPYIRLFAMIRRTVAEFGRLLYEDWGLFLNWRAHADAGDPLWRAALEIHRALLARRISRKYRQCVRLVNRGLRSPYRWALPDALGRFGHAILRFSTQLKAQGQTQIAEDLRQHAFKLFQVEAQTAVETRNESRITNAAMNAILASTIDDQRPDEWGANLMKHVRNPDYRQRFETMLDHARRRRAGEEFPQDIKTTDEQIYQVMAAALGIDLSDRGSPDAALIRIGIRDRNPERVLRLCEHLEVRLGHYTNAIAEAMRLPTAGTKALQCGLHHYTLEGLSLDGLSNEFQKRFCDSCPDKKSRPAGWKWNLPDDSRPADMPDKR